MTRACERCGAAYSVKPSRAKTSRYCSLECHGQNRRHKAAARPLKSCKACGKDIPRLVNGKVRARYDRALFCDAKCHGDFYSGANHPAWKGDAALATTKRARRDNPPLPPGTLCACGAPALDRHHEDGDPGHNVPENLTAKCRRCHMAEDGRLAAFIAGRYERGKVVPQEQEDESA